MKKIVFIISAISFLISCDSPKPNPNPDNATPNFKDGVLSGKIASNLSIPKGKYKLKGTVEVEEGATLTVAPGTEFSVSLEDKDRTNVLVIKQGAKIMAEGTAAEPIVFTAENKTSGAWSGIILLGKSTLNVAGGTATAEAGGYPYGGTIPNDNSGTLKYVRVEYAGARVQDGSGEYNAFSFFGIGSGTTLDYLEAYAGADDGFEFYGGAVQATHLLAINCEDDAFDWDQGFTGGGSDWIAQQNNVADNGIEASNHSVEYDKKPLAKPTVNRITITKKEARSDQKETVAINLKEGTGANLSNVYVTGSKVFILIDSATAALANRDAGRLTLTSIRYDAATTDPIKKVRGAGPDITIPSSDPSLAKPNDSWVSTTWAVGYTR